MSIVKNVGIISLFIFFFFLYISEENSNRQKLFTFQI